jgi:hypothetical protein
LFQKQEKNIHARTKCKENKTRVRSKKKKNTTTTITTQSINEKVVCGASVVFGPSLALRGLTKDDVERAVTGERLVSHIKKRTFLHRSFPS